MQLRASEAGNRGDLSTQAGYASPRGHLG